MAVDFSDFDEHDKIRLISYYAKLGATDPLVNELSHALVQGVPARDRIAQAQALLSYVQDKVRYVDDGTQMLRTADYTIEHPTGNCVSQGSILFGALAQSITIPVRFEVLSKKILLVPGPIGQWLWKLGIYRKEPFHVYPTFQDNAGNWIPVEPTQPWPIGKDPAEYAEQHADEL
jgi:transglutaminase-like putative cysteine protease